MKCVNTVDQITIVGAYASSLVYERPIRDLETAEYILSSIWNSTPYYEPCLCAYVYLFYVKKEYEKSAALGLELHERTKRSTKWKGHPPLVPLGYAAMAYRRL
jgi:hypothetical protein